MNHSKILAIGAVFIMIAAAFTGVCFVSEETDATASKIADSNGNYTKLVGTNSEISVGTYNVAVGCVINITFQIAPAQFSLSVSDDSYGITAGYDSSIGYRYISGTVAKTGTFTVTGTARDGSSGTYTFNAYDAASSSTTSSVLGFENFISKAADCGMDFSYTYDSYGFVDSFSGEVDCNEWIDNEFDTQTVYCALGTTIDVTSSGSGWDDKSYNYTFGCAETYLAGDCDSDGENETTFLRFVAVNTDEFYTEQLVEDDEVYDSLADESIEYLVGYTIVVSTGRTVTIGGASSVCGIGYNVTPDSTFSVELGSSSLSFYATEAGKIAYVEIGTDADNVTGVVMIKSEEAEETPTYYTHTITYSTDGGSSVSNTVVTDTNSGSSSVTLASAPTKFSYNFTGWLVNGTLYKAGDSVSVAANSSVTATAQWNVIIYRHIITYSTDEGSSVSNTVVTDTNPGSTSLTLASAPTKSGYTFKGWMIGNTTYAAGDKVSVAANSSVTATAQWSENTVSASASDIYGKTNISVTNQITASANNGGTISYAIKSVTGGSASVSPSGLVTYKCPAVTSTTTNKVTVTVTGTFSDGSTISKDVAFDVIVDPILAFTNSVTDGSLSVKGTGA